MSSETTPSEHDPCDAESEQGEQPDSSPTDDTGDEPAPAPEPLAEDRPAPADSVAASLLDPLALGTLELANRIVLSPLTTGLAGKDGSVTPELTSYLVERARGGAGLIMTEETGVSELGLLYEGMLRLDTNDCINGFRALVEQVHESRVPVAVTITQGPWEDAANASDEELTQLPERFAKAARRAQIAGADAVAIQLGNGHALGQLLAPTSRENEDGEEEAVPLEERLRIPLAVLAAVRSEVEAALPLIACLTLDERTDGGLSGDEASELARRVGEANVQALLVTAGTVQSPMYAAPCHYVVPLLAPALAAEAKAATSVPVIASGGIRTVSEAREILANGQADLVGMPRALLADPEFPKKLSAGRDAEIIPCLACNQACVVARAGRRVGCVTNPRAGHEHTPRPLRLLNPRDMVVVGGGPAGVVAAAAASRRGFHVTLFERDDELGGRFRLASVPPYKGLLARYVDWLRQALDGTNVTVKLGEQVGYEAVRRLAPEVVILATGASLDLPETIPGIDDPLMPGFVVTADDVLAGKAPVGQRVMIVGARRVGLETADYLAEDGRDVIVCDSSQAPDALVPNTVKPLLEERLKKGKVEVLADATVTRVRDTVVFVDHKGHVAQYDELDTLVVACGWRRNDELAERLAEHIETVAVVGDARRPRTAMAAIREAYTTVAEL